MNDTNALLQGIESDAGVPPAEAATPAEVAAPAPAKRAAKASGKAAGSVTSGTTRIILEENDEIPPTGQPVCVNGKMWVIVPGQEVDVPEEVLHVLDNAVTQVAVLGEGNRVVGFRPRSRLPYRVVAKNVN